MPRAVPHFKVMTSIQNHCRIMGVYQDDALLAMYVRIGIMAVERFADRTDDAFLCSGMDVERLAGCRGVANAMRKLGRLTAMGGPEVGQEGDHYQVRFYNFAKRQGFHQKNGAEKEVSATSTSSSTTTTTKQKEGPDGPPKSPALQASEKGTKPDKFVLRDRDDIEAWATGKGYSGAVLTSAMERFREWEPLKQQTRTQKQWVAAFKRICREAVEAGQIVGAIDNRERTCRCMPGSRTRIEIQSLTCAGCGSSLEKRDLGSIPVREPGEGA